MLGCTIIIESKNIPQTNSDKKFPEKVLLTR